MSRSVVSPNYDCDYTTLQQVLQTDRSTFCNGEESRDLQAEGNCNYSVQYRAESSRGMGILEAAQKQLMHVTGASMYSIRSWAAMYFECKIGTALEEMDDSAMEILLSLDRGKGVKNPLKYSLICDEDFQKGRAQSYCRHVLKVGARTLIVRSALKQHKSRTYSCISLVLHRNTTKGCLLGQA